MNKLNFKIKSVCLGWQVQVLGTTKKKKHLLCRGPVRRQKKKKRQATDWEKICANHTFRKGLQYIWNSQNPTIKKSNQKMSTECEETHDTIRCHPEA
jgi:hypothetical protein